MATLHQPIHIGYLQSILPMPRQYGMKYGVLAFLEPTALTLV
jgi:hypothetical protein